MIRLPEQEWLKSLLFGLFIVLGTLLATLIGYNLGFTHHLAGDQEVRPWELQRAMQNFHQEEVSGNYAFFWTQAESHICLQALGRIPQARVTLVFLGDGAALLGHTEAHLLVNGEPLASLPMLAGARRYHVLVGPQLSGQDDHCFTLTSETAILPSHSRPLGVPFVSFDLQPVGSELVMPAREQLLINLLVALVCAWLLRAFGLPRWLVGLMLFGTVVALLSLIGAGFLIVGVAVNRMLPPVIGGLAVTAAGIAAARRWALHPRLTDPWSGGLLARDLAGMAFWSIVLWGGIEVIQFYSGHTGGVWPLKANLYPAYTPLVVVPIALFALWIGLVLVQVRRVEDGLGTTPANWRILAPPLLLIFIGALLLPVVLKGTVRGWESLYTTFANEYDYQHDVPRFNDALTILRDYVALSPTLSHHNSNHPPGSLLLLWGVVQIAGPGVVVTSWVAMLLGCLAVLAAVWLGWQLGGPLLGLLAGAIFVVMPGHQIYNVTSMDALFSALIALGAVGFLLALEPKAGLGKAVLSGALIALALFFTYTATQLFFLGVVTFIFAVLRAYPPGGGWQHLLRSMGHPLRQGLISAATILLLYLLLYVATGFNVVEAVRKASALNSIAMHGVDSMYRPLPFLPPSMATYTDFLAPNIAPFLWYFAPWGMTALSAVLLSRIFQHRKFEFLDSIVFALAGVVLGMWLSGLFIREVERVWAFTYPLTAVLIAYHVWQGPSQAVRLWRLGLFLALFSAQAVLMRTWLYTFW
ncbi:hypothetical protein [Candidatus Viridilinea mediisalina]|uniref:Glycosyltransferase RgtA/B/C/D-like domain-containing protein n=1 Tax=Candidatus Viridilinea mediisalina TaxID=2024553 RepID=A0A2A6RFD0_9CHLR|nr:hypothetical protein [Candidatus Viridilinea mediisalina]PDW01653.1 hypothetical protein CJ255_18010 [Candidatus Viridilinea mediisalina]